MKEEKAVPNQTQIGFPGEKAEQKAQSPKVENKQLLIDLLTRESDQFAQESQLLRKKRESEKINFIGGAEFSIKDIQDIVMANAQRYRPMFPNDNPFFKEMYRLNGWTDRDPNEWIKPLPVPNWINEIIYGRFSKDVLPAIQILNPFLPGMCIRGFKNFQFLNEEGQNLVLQYRDQAVEVMEKCQTWHEFRLKMAKEHGVPYVYQNSLF
ncbi:MAG: P63C domain-containing protein [Chitinophagaceae bacterium]